MLVQVKDNLERNRSSENKRGQTIYRILETLFRSADSTQKVDLTRELGIPPVYQVPHARLVNDSGQIIIQIFFTEMRMVAIFFRDSFACSIPHSGEWTIPIRNGSASGLSKESPF